MRKSDVWTKEYFEKEFEKKDPWKFFTSDYEQKKYKRQIYLIKDRKKNPKRILEIGCAEGAHTIMLSQEFPQAKIDAVDLSDTAIQRAKETVESNNVQFICAYMIEYIDKIKDGAFDIIVWSESVYYIGNRLNIKDIFEFFEKLVKKLKREGVLCMANIINQTEGPESPLTKRQIMECYFSMLSNFIKPINKSIYLEYKKESGRHNEYQIWLFERE